MPAGASRRPKCDTRGVDSPSTADVIACYVAMTADGGAAAVERDIVTVNGPDAARYLQGQLSQDVVAMAGANAWSFLLAPTGRVVAWLRVHRIDAEQYILETDPGSGDAVRARLQRFLLRTRADIAEPQRRRLVQHRWDPSSVRLGLEAPPGALVAPAVGPGVGGIDELYLDTPPPEVAELGSDVAASDAIERYRIAHGIVRMGTELDDDTIPGEAGAWVIDLSVSFTKGCYTGQELVARIDSRGNNVPRPMRLLSLDADVMPGDEVRFEGSVVGTITSAARALGDAFPALALARVGRSAVPGVTVEVIHDSIALAASVIEPGTLR